MKQNNKVKMMKKRMLIFAGSMLAIAVLLAGCGAEHREQEAKKLVEEYLGELKAQVSDETLYLTDAEAENFGKMIAFIAYSERYGDDFRIYVNTDNSISDSYFAVSLKDSAEQECAELLESVFPNKGPAFELSVDKSIVSSALSGKVFTSVKEAHRALNNAFGLLNVVIMPSDSSEVSDEALDGLLKAMLEAGFYGDLRISDDVRVFHISETEIDYTRTDDPAGEVRYYNWASSQTE